jgi:hypothetical protein
VFSRSGWLKAVGRSLKAFSRSLKAFSRSLKALVAVDYGNPYGDRHE